MISALPPVSIPAPSRPVTLDLVIPLAPPTDRTLRYQTTRTRTIAGLKVVQTVVRDVRFMRDAAGVLTVETRLVDSHADGPPAVVTRLQAASAVLLNHGFRFRVGGDGRVIPIDAEGDWAAVRRAFAPIVAGGTAPPADSPNNAAREIFAYVDALSPTARADLLIGEVAPVLRFAGCRIVAGAGCAPARDYRVGIAGASVLALTGVTSAGAREIAEIDRTSGLVLLATRTEADKSDRTELRLLDK